MKKKYRIVHYLNQFFAQIGGEEAAGCPMVIKNEVVGPGLAFEKNLGEDYEIVATIICGDNYFADHETEVLSQIVDTVKEWNPDILLAGPAFNAGRYGPACGAVCKAVQEEMNIPTVTGMYEENPGVEMFRKDCYIVKTKNSAVGMRNAVKAMSNLVIKLLNHQEVLPERDEYFYKGFKKNIFVEKNGAERAVEMLLNKLKGVPFETEIQVPVYEKVTPANPVTDLKNAKIALVTDAGVTDKENINGLESARATKYLALDITGRTYLSAEDFCSVHGGFDTSIANQNPNVLVPLDILYGMKEKGLIGDIYPTLYSTTGNGTSLKNSKQFGKEIAQKLQNAEVDAVILTST